MAKLEFLARGINDKIVKDSLCAAAEIDNFPKGKDLYFLVGGIATQTYVPDDLRRDTCDVDFATLKPFSHTEFRDFAAPAIEYLRDHGYSVETKKGHQVYQLYVDSSEGNKVLVEFCRRSNKSHEQARQRLEREMGNARKKIVPGRSQTIKVCSPEDIAIPKFTRLINSLNRNPDFCEYVLGRQPGHLDAKEVARQLGMIAGLREDARFALGNPEIAEKLRFAADMYDIRVLSEYGGFNEDYLLEASRDWTTISLHPAMRDLLANYLFPEIDFKTKSQEKDNRAQERLELIQP